MKERAHMRSKNAGFSLIEAAVVLTLIGIVAGVILSGRSMMHRAELRSVLTDASSYATAIQQFKIKYSYLPGDFPTATSVWGRADGGVPVTGNCVNIFVDSPDGIKTCNGDGDGIIEPLVLGSFELYQAWVQVSASGMINGKFAGRALPNIGAIIGRNVPKGPMEGTGYSIGNGEVISDTLNSDYFVGNYTNSMLFGGAIVERPTWGPALLPKEAFELDSKRDDALPSTGLIRGFKSTSVNNPNCVTAAGAYDETFRDPACALIFMDGFATRP